MAEQTVNMDLRKPAGSDQVNVTTDLSENFDKIDALAFMNRPSRTDLAPKITWNGSSISVAGGVESKAPLATLQCRTSIGHDNESWCRIYTVQLQPGENLSFRATFDNLRTALTSHHGIMVTCRAYNYAASAPDIAIGCSDSDRLPVKAAWIAAETEGGAGTLEIWAMNRTYQAEHTNTPIWFGSVQWLYSTMTGDMVNYSAADTMLFPDTTGPVEGGPVDGDPSSGRTYALVTSGV